jgi:hypothetical protein
MIKQRDIRGFVASYHRNGVAGEGFHACSFHFRDGTRLIPLRAIVFEANGCVAVISDNLVQRWRGDDFESALREAIRLQDAAQPMRAHEHTEV